MSDDMNLPDLATVLTADEARDVAITWQEWQSDEALSYSQLAMAQAYFTQLADMFDLRDEFEENGVI